MMRRTLVGALLAAAVLAATVPAVAGPATVHQAAGRGYIGALPVPPATPAHLGFAASAISGAPGIGAGIAVYQATPTGALVTIALTCVAVTDLGAGHQLVASGVDLSLNAYFIRVVDTASAAPFSDAAGVSTTATTGACSAEGVAADTFFGEAVITPLL